jgi:hypothetical protein
MDLIVIFAECPHGGRIEAVSVQQAHGTWTVEAVYDCDERCTEKEVSAEMPANVVDTSGAVHWSAP